LSNERTVLDIDPIVGGTSSNSQSFTDPEITASRYLNEK